MYLLPWIIDASSSYLLATFFKALRGGQCIYHNTFKPTTKATAPIKSNIAETFTELGSAGRTLSIPAEIIRYTKSTHLPPRMLGRELSASRHAEQKWRRRRFTTDTFSCLRQVPEKGREQQVQLYIAFADLIKCFDVIGRSRLYKLLDGIGHAPLNVMVTAFYDNMKATPYKPSYCTAVRHKQHSQGVPSLCYSPCSTNFWEGGPVPEDMPDENYAKEYSPEVTTTKGSLEQCSSYVFHLLLLKLWYRSVSLCLNWTSITDCSGAHPIVLRDREAAYYYHMYDASWWCACRWVHLIDVVVCLCIVLCLTPTISLTNGIIFCTLQVTLVAIWKYIHPEHFSLQN